MFGWLHLAAKTEMPKSAPPVVSNIQFTMGMQSALLFLPPEARRT